MNIESGDDKKGNVRVQHWVQPWLIARPSTWTQRRAKTYHRHFTEYSSVICFVTNMCKKGVWLCLRITECEKMQFSDAQFDVWMKADMTHNPVVYTCHRRAERTPCSYISHLERRRGGKALRRKSCSLFFDVLILHKSILHFTAGLDRQRSVGSWQTCQWTVRAVWLRCAIYTGSPLKPNLISAPVEMRHCVPAWKNKTNPTSPPVFWLLRYHRNYTLSDPIDVVHS